jgi:hypothetical protein
VRSSGSASNDLDAQLAARQCDRVAELLELRAALADPAGVDAVDLRAATPQQLDQAEVLVVPAVGDVEVASVDAIAAEQLPK